MNYCLIVGILVLILLILYFLVTYNKLVKNENKVKEAFATMDVYLKKRWDLIPNIVEIVKGYSKYEKDALKEVVNLRKNFYDSMTDDKKIEANNELSRGITKLMSLAESYPNLKANENFLSLSEELSSIEDEIAQSRKYYNAVVRDYNNLVEMIPNNIVAKIFGKKSKTMFNIDEKSKENVRVSL